MRTPEEIVQTEVYHNIDALVSEFMKMKQETGEECYWEDNIQNLVIYPEERSQNSNFFFPGGTNDDRIGFIGDMVAKHDSTADISEAHREKAKAFKLKHGYEHRKQMDKLYDLYHELGEFIDTLNSLEQEDQEIMEWISVSDWLYNKLNKKCEPVLNIGCTYIWGRTTYGQLYCSDHIIQQIAKEIN